MRTETNMEEEGTSVRSILVGVDGSDSGLRAAECAAHEALRRESRMTLLIAYDESLGGAVSRWPSDMDKQDALAAGRRAKEHVHEIGPGLQVDVELAPGSPAEVLLDHAEAASVVVVGLRGRGGFPGMQIGSVAYQVAAHAPGHVLVVGPEGENPRSSEIVVGVDGSSHADQAVAAAMETASHRGDVVRAVWAWAPHILPSALARSRANEPEDVDKAQERALEAVLAPHLARYPGVEVKREVVRGQPMAALLGAADRARMIAVGARGTRGFARLALGGVAHALLHHAPCPVLVVHHS